MGTFRGNQILFLLITSQRNSRQRNNYNDKGIDLEKIETVLNHFQAQKEGKTENQFQSYQKIFLAKKAVENPEHCKWTKRSSLKTSKNWPSSEFGNSFKYRLKKNTGENKIKLLYSYYLASPLLFSGEREERRRAVHCVSGLHLSPFETMGTAQALFPRPCFWGQTLPCSDSLLSCFRDGSLQVIRSFEQTTKPRLFAISEWDAA